MNKEFEDWASQEPYVRNLKKFGKKGVLTGQYVDYATQLAYETWNNRQAKLNAQAEEIAKLREFANKIYSHYLNMSFGAAKDNLEEEFYRCGLLDMNPDQTMSPTKLLLGEK